MGNLTYRQFTNKLRAAGWVSYGQGHYIHVDKNARIALFDAVVFDGKAQELWRYYAERGELPDPDKTQMERHAMIGEAT